jgi:hypothetical protein
MHASLPLTVLLLSALQSAPPNSSMLPARQYTATAAQPQDDAFFGFLAIDGVWNGDTAFISRVIRYPGHEACGGARDIDFFSQAERAFGDHLRAYYAETFRNGAGNNIQRFYRPQHSTSDRLRTRQAAELRLSQWVGEQRSRGYKLVQTTFTYTCG